MKDTVEQLTVLREMLEAADCSYRHRLDCAEKADIRAALFAAIKAMEDSIELHERTLVAEALTEDLTRNLRHILEGDDIYLQRLRREFREFKEDLPQDLVTFLREIVAAISTQKRNHNDRY